MPSWAGGLVPVPGTGPGRDQLPQPLPREAAGEEHELRDLGAGIPLDVFICDLVDRRLGHPCRHIRP